MKTFSADESAYYRRHLALPEVGAAGQEKLKRSSVLVIGLGGLGSPLSLYLAAAGVGRIGVVEFDRVDRSNLHRQILYGSSQVGESKLDAAVARLRDLNPHIEIVPYASMIDSSNARELIRGYQVVADGADNFATRYLVNDACILEKRPLVSASILAFEGQLSVLGHAGGPCYRCLYPEPPPAGAVPSCAEGGVLGVLPGVMGSLQATEVLKLILGLGELASGRLLTYDALALRFSVFKVPRDPGCALCGDHPTIRELVDYEELCGVAREGAPEISVPETAKLLANDSVVLVDVRESEEREESRIEGAIHLPLDEVLEGRALPPRDRPIIVHCRSGARSQAAALYLLNHGYSDVRSLAGGILAWEEAGLSKPKP